jgi:hypothetical protein
VSAVRLNEAYMVETTDIANEIRKHLAGGVSQGVLIALVAYLADLFPDMTAEQLASALHEAIEELHKPRSDIPIA